MNPPLLPYFAYGSNLSSSQMAERCPGATPLGPARLHGYRLAFDAWSKRRHGLVADVVRDPTSHVWGVLWNITPEHATTLDTYEGVATGMYRRHDVKVEVGENPRIANILKRSKAFAASIKGPTPRDAFLYVICEPGEEGPTTQPYLDLLLEGAREFNLPNAWIRHLESVPTVPPADTPTPPST